MPEPEPAVHMLILYLVYDVTTLKLGLPKSHDTRVYTVIKIMFTTRCCFRGESSVCLPFYVIDKWWLWVCCVLVNNQKQTLNTALKIWLAIEKQIARDCTKNNALSGGKSWWWYYLSHQNCFLSWLVADEDRVSHVLSHIEKKKNNMLQA